MYEANRREVSINYKLWRNLLPLEPSLVMILSNKKYINNSRVSEVEFCEQYFTTGNVLEMIWRIERLTLLPFHLETGLFLGLPLCCN